MKSPATVSPSSAGPLFSPGSRRDFLKAAALGGAAVAIPSLLTGCKVGETSLGTTGPTSALLTIDFSTGDTAYLKFLSVFKQVQADLYVKTAATFSTSDFSVTQQALITDIKNHEIIHRDTIAAVLGTSNAITVTPNWGSVNLKKAADVFSQAIRVEDVSIGLLNGMLQHLLSSANIALLLSIQSVDGRHSAALRDDQLPKSGTPSGYSPGVSDGAYALSSVGASLQGVIVETLQYTNAPAGL
ncbi:MAG: ferritin-like domain-containing protein [Gemmatimonadota bacterium]|nr:ferritin-like domain-containing protein [Gemmatimonadota bacterium]